MTSGSQKLIAMRAWVAALKSYDEAWAPYQRHGADQPTPVEQHRLAGLSARVDDACERYQSLSWGGDSSEVA